MLDAQPFKVATEDATIELYASNSMAHQSAAVFGAYLFLVTKGHTYLYMYDLKDRQMLCSLKMAAGVGVTYYGTDLYHCNQMSFGVDYYDVADPFPLLYISQRSEQDYRCFTEVYRIIPERDSVSEQYSSMTVQRIQTIHFPAMSAKNSMGNVNSVIDHKNKLLYTYSRNNNKTDSNYSKCTISSFNIPDYTLEDVYLEDTDILNSFMLDCSAVNMQGGCIKDGLLYVGQGFSSAGYIYLNIIDLNRQEILARIDLYALEIRWEPEGVFFYDKKLLISSNDNFIWMIDVPLGVQ